MQWKERQLAKVQTLHLYFQNSSFGEFALSLSWINSNGKRILQRNEEKLISNEEETANHKIEK